MKIKITREELTYVLPHINVLRTFYSYKGQYNDDYVGWRKRELKYMTLYSAGGSLWYFLVGDKSLDAHPQIIKASEYKFDYIELAYEWMKGNINRENVLTAILRDIRRRNAKQSEKKNNVQ